MSAAGTVLTVSLPLTLGTKPVCSLSLFDNNAGIYDPYLYPNASTTTAIVFQTSANILSASHTYFAMYKC